VSGTFSTTRANLSLGLGHLLVPVLAAGSVAAAWRNRARWWSTDDAQRIEHGHDIRDRNGSGVVRAAGCVAGDTADHCIETGDC
jgi:hypothetical protein